MKHLSEKEWLEQLRNNGRGNSDTIANILKRLEMVAFPPEAETIKNLVVELYNGESKEEYDKIFECARSLMMHKAFLCFNYRQFQITQVGFDSPEWHNYDATYVGDNYCIVVKGVLV